jgi:hypothetical protein
LIVNRILISILILTSRRYFKVMKRFCCGVAVVLTWTSIASGGEVDTRFDGKWIGVEIFPLTSKPYSLLSKVPRVTTVIAIAQSGTMLGVLSGFVPGQYPISPKSGGKTLIFHGGNGKEGRNDCRLELSADGNTFKESGSVVIFVPPRGFASAQVYATFHRVME